MGVEAWWYGRLCRLGSAVGDTIHSSEPWIASIGRGSWFCIAYRTKCVRLTRRPGNIWHVTYAAWLTSIPQREDAYAAITVGFTVVGSCYLKINTVLLRRARFCYDNINLSFDKMELYASRETQITALLITILRIIHLDSLTDDTIALVILFLLYPSF